MLTLCIKHCSFKELFDLFPFSCKYFAYKYFIRFELCAFWGKIFPHSCFVQVVCFDLCIYLLILLSHCTFTCILLVFMKYGCYIMLLRNVSRVRYLVENSVAFVYVFPILLPFRFISLKCFRIRIKYL